MNHPEAVERRPRWSRRRKVGVLLVFYVVAISATIPCIEMGDGRAAQLAAIHESKAAQCRMVGQKAEAGEAQRLDQTARNHDWHASAYHRLAARTRWTWFTWLIRSANELGQRHIPGPTP